MNIFTGLWCDCTASPYVFVFLLCVETYLRAGWPGFSSRQGQWWDFSFSSPPRPDRLWVPGSEADHSPPIPILHGMVLS